MADPKMGQNVASLALRPAPSLSRLESDNSVVENNKKRKRDAITGVRSCHSRQTSEMNVTANRRWRLEDIENAVESKGGAYINILHRYHKRTLLLRVDYIGSLVIHTLAIGRGPCRLECINGFSNCRRYLTSKMA